MNPPEKENIASFGDHPSSSGDGGGGGGNFGERLARIEERVNHLATSAELKALHIDIEKMKAQFNMAKWLLGIIAVAVVGFASRYLPVG